MVGKVAGLTDSVARRRLVHHRRRPVGWSNTCAGRNSAGSNSCYKQRLDDNRRLHDRDWEFVFRPEESLSTLITEYRAQCDQSRLIAAGYPLEHQVPHRRLGAVSLRWIYVHMIEETARHAGQLDILREQLDGRVGDD